MRVSVAKSLLHLIKAHTTPILDGMTSRLPGLPSKSLGARRNRYRKILQINGTHPLREAVPNGFVDYPARTRHGGKIMYFNFSLAKEMGLIPADTPHEVDDDLSAVLLEAFGLVIINEYDVLHHTPISAHDVRSGKYMATRYLQLQHPSKRGYTSGDGRSVWNGCFSGSGGTWDVSSCGTGATRLSPACAIENKFFKTGDKRVSYGCGCAELVDGLSAAVLSEIFHLSEIPTERTLAVIDYGDGTSINVRAGRNLLRPAHFFHHLKQGDYVALKGAVDYYCARQITNGDWPALRNGKARYRYLLRRVAEDFARAAALFEREYIFCWMEWDGDNILMDGGIIDYGSVRQFGLYHHEYRYDDVERMSTTITEQRNKARYIVQAFAQIADFLIKGKKRNIRKFARDPVLTLFDRVFADTKDEVLAYKLGLPPRAMRAVLDNRPARARLRRFAHVYRYFEEGKSARGPREVSDGISWDAIFCVRDALRELPLRYLEAREAMEPHAFLQLMRSTYASAADLTLTRSRKERIRDFQAQYLEIMERAACLTGQSVATLLRQIARRSQHINRYERVTGDAVIWIAKRLAEQAKHLSSAERQQLLEEFIATQVLRPEFQEQRRSRAMPRSAPAQALLQKLLKIVAEHREGL